MKNVVIIFNLKNQNKCYHIERTDVSNFGSGKSPASKTSNSHAHHLRLKNKHLFHFFMNVAFLSFKIVYSLDPVEVNLRSAFVSGS